MKYFHIAFLLFLCKAVFNQHRFSALHDLTMLQFVQSSVKVFERICKVFYYFTLHSFKYVLAVLACLALLKQGDITGLELLLDITKQQANPSETFLFFRRTLISLGSDWAEFVHLFKFPLVLPVLRDLDEKNWGDLPA